MIISTEAYLIKDFQNKIEVFFSAVKFGRFLTDRNLDFNQSVKYEISRFIDYSKTAKVLFIFNDCEILGILGHKDSIWDSEHFGFNVVSIDYFLVKEDQKYQNQVAKLIVDELDKKNSADSIKLAMAKVDSSFFAPVKALQQHNFVFFECITARSYYVNTNATIETTAPRYRMANLGDREAIIKIAEDNTFKKSHFYLDDNFLKKDIDSLYSKWIETAIKPDSEKKIIVIEEKGKIAAVFIYSIHRYKEFEKDTFGKWEFAAVSKEFRKSGIGRELFQSAFKACINDGASIIDSTLVDKNIISQHLHEILNFRISNTYYTFHKWY
jgi:GNAT superfamily N-acetyltransferase